MPVQKAKSGLAAKYGQKLASAVAKHGGDETKYGIVKLPPGIKNGVAQLVEAKFDTYKSGDNEGEYYFQGRGVVIEPEFVTLPTGGKMKVAGLHTMIMMPVHETKTAKGEVRTLEENVAKILNEMRKLGADTSDASMDDLEAMAVALKEARPYFRFRTSQGKPTPEYPDPKVFENWDGNKGLDDYEKPEGAGVEDETGGGDDDEDEAHAANGFDEFGDLATLAKKANKGDATAQARLKKLAVKAGVDEGDVDGADDWDEVVGMMTKGKKKAKLAPAAEEDEDDESDDTETVSDEDDEAGDDDSTNEDEEEEVAAPQVEEIYHYRPMDDKTKKPVKKPAECEVVAVDEKKQTVTLKNLDKPSVKYVGIPWASLIRND